MPCAPHANAPLQPAQLRSRGFPSCLLFKFHDSNPAFSAPPLPLSIASLSSTRLPGCFVPYLPSAELKADLRAPSLRARGSDVARQGQALRSKTDPEPGRRGRCAALSGAQADLARAPLPIGRHLGRRGRPRSGHLASPLRREIGGCRARTPGGKGIRREGSGPLSSSQRPALFCQPPRRGRCSDAPATASPAGNFARRSPPPS